MKLQGMDQITERLTTTEFIDNLDYQNIKSFGFNTVRNFIHLPWLMPTASGVIDETYFTVDAPVGTGQWRGASIDHKVQWCREIGLKLILSIIPFARPTPTWAGMDNMTAQEKWMAFIDGSAIEYHNALIQSWQFIIDRYGNDVIIPEIVTNEPMPDGDMPIEYDRDLYNTLYSKYVEDLIDAIRTVAPGTPIIVNPTHGWFQTEFWKPVNRNNIKYGLHWYRPNARGPYDRNEPWPTSVDPTRYDQMVREWYHFYDPLASFGKPIIVSEIGRRVNPDLGGALDWFEDSFGLMKKNGIVEWVAHSYGRHDDPFVLNYSDGSPREPYMSFIQTQIPKASPLTYVTIIVAILGGLYFIKNYLKK